MTLDDTINDISALGGLPFYLLMSVMLAVYYGGAWLVVLVVMLSALIVMFGITALMRMLWFRHRPKPREHGTFLQRIDAGSFPSLHSMRAAFLATMVIFISGFSPLAFLFGVPSAALVAWARLEKKAHRIIDVTVGAAIGIMIAVMMVVIIAQIALS